MGVNACGQSVSPAGGRPSLHRGGVLGSFPCPRGCRLCVGGAGGVIPAHLLPREGSRAADSSSRAGRPGSPGLSAPALLLFRSLNLGKPPGQKRAVFSSSRPWTRSPCSHESGVGVSELPVWTADPLSAWPASQSMAGTVRVHPDPGSPGPLD